MAHVRVCRECGEEYRPEIAVCADCGGELEDRHDDAGDRWLQRTEVKPEPAPAPEAPPDGYEPLSTLRSTLEVVAVAEALKGAGIPFRVIGDRKPSTFQLFVPMDEQSHAREALGSLIDGQADPDLVDRDFDPEVGYRRCPACRGDVRPGEEECPSCGLGVGPVTEVCSACERPVQLDAKQCPGCGKVFSAED